MSLIYDDVVSLLRSNYARILSHESITEKLYAVIDVLETYNPSGSPIRYVMNWEEMRLIINVLEGRIAYMSPEAEDVKDEVVYILRFIGAL